MYFHQTKVASYGNKGRRCQTSYKLQNNFYMITKNAPNKLHVTANISKDLQHLQCATAKQVSWMA